MNKSYRTYKIYHKGFFITAELERFNGHLYLNYYMIDNKKGDVTTRTIMQSFKSIKGIDKYLKARVNEFNKEIETPNYNYKKMLYKVWERGL